MFCIKCGTQNNDASKFCAKCGEPLSSNAGGAQPAPAASQPQVAASAAQPQAAPVAAAPAAQPQYSAPAPSAPQYAAPAAGVPQAPEGNIGAAWKDITSSPNWFKRVLMLCLIGCVPILNFAVNGYCIRWARELSFGRRAELPATIFKKKEISTGFFAFLISLGLGLAFGMVIVAGFLLITGLFGVVSWQAGGIIAVILLIAIVVFVMIFVSPIVDASVMRMSVVGYLESGFNFKTVISAFRKGMGGLIGASLLPRIIVGFVGSLMVGILSAIFLAILGGIGMSAAGAYSSNPLGFLNFFTNNPGLGYSAVSGTIYLALFMYLVIYIFSAMVQVFSELFAYRAVGHWVSRFAPEWAGESDEEQPLDDNTGEAII